MNTEKHYSTCSSCGYCCHKFDIPFFLNHECPQCSLVTWVDIDYKEKLEIEIKNIREEGLKLFEENIKLRNGFKEAINRLDFAKEVITKKDAKRIAVNNYNTSKKELKEIDR